MKPFTRMALLLIIAGASFTSCKKSTPKQTKHIPKDAVFVAEINSKSLQDKLSKNQATLENIFKSFADSDSSVTKGKNEWEDFKNSGIDLSDNVFMSVVKKGGGMTGGNSMLSAIAVLKDASKLEAYLKKKQPNSEVRKEKDYSYTISGDNMIAWNDDLVIAFTYQQAYSGMEFDSTTGSYNLRRPVNAETDLKAEATAYFNLKEDESIASIPEFRDLMQEKSDACFWVNSASTLENIPFPLPKLKELFGNSFTSATVNFDDGKIDVKTKSYYSQQFRDILKKYTGSTVNLDLIKNYPSNNINGFFAFAFDPQMIDAIVKYLEVGGMVDGYLTKFMGSNYTLQDALKAIKGDFAFIYSDFHISTPKAPNAVSQPMQPPSMNFGKMLINVPVGDKAQMNRLMDKMVQQGLLVKTANEYRVSPLMRRIGMQVLVDDKNLLISTDSSLMETYKAGTQKAMLPNDVMDDFKGKSGVFYVNLESIFNGIPYTAADSTMSVVIPQAKETFRDMKGYTENFNGKNIEGHFEVRFKNDKQNSLTSLLQFTNTMAQTFKAHQRVVVKAKLGMPADTSAE